MSLPKYKFRFEIKHILLNVSVGACILLMCMFAILCIMWTFENFTYLIGELDQLLAAIGIFLLCYFLGKFAIKKML